MTDYFERYHLEHVQGTNPRQRLVPAEYGAWVRYEDVMRHLRERTGGPLPEGGDGARASVTSGKLTEQWFCLVSDNDGHWYVIREDEKLRFNSWVNDVKNGETKPPDWKRFDGECRVDGPYFVAFKRWRESHE